MKPSIRKKLHYLTERKGKARNPQRIPVIMSSVRRCWNLHPDISVTDIVSGMKVSYLTEDHITYKRLSGNKLTVPLWLPESEAAVSAQSIINEMESGIQDVHLPLHVYLREDGNEKIDLTMSALEMSWMGCWTWRFGELMSNITNSLGDDAFDNPERFLRSSEEAWYQINQER